jgi:hypothetical protein
MADFAIWATACETGLWPAVTLTRAYTANRKSDIEGIIDADPIAACVREFMSERSSWTGSAADLLRVSVGTQGGRQATGPAGLKIRAPSPATCVGCRHLFGRSASTLPSAVKAEPEAESSGCARLSKIRQHRQQRPR